jgi:RsiW-degrading membrane proteinase PrsW (M82 family)
MASAKSATRDSAIRAPNIDPFAIPGAPAPSLKPAIPRAPPSPVAEARAGRETGSGGRGGGGTKFGIGSPPPNLFGTERTPYKVGQGAAGELRYWLLGFALIPLILSLFQPDDTQERIEHTVKRMLKEHPEKFARATHHGEDEGGEEESDSSEEDPGSKLFSLMPDDRIEGAYLPHHTYMHWAFGLIAAIAYWGLVLLLFPLGKATPRQLLYAGLFTGTGGILLLLGFQYAAMYSLLIRSRSIVVIFLQFIAFSYYCAMNPHGGVLISFVGFTCGVGLCEEFCKGMVLLYHFKTKGSLDWRGACVWGLASGIGFGVSEGIMYSGSMYNGLFGPSIYLIRFISCVSLHAVWSASVGLAAWRYRHALKVSWRPVFKILWAPMVMHGLYDTLATKNYPGGAVLCALAGFAWLAYQFERTYAENAKEAAVVA